MVAKPSAIDPDQSAIPVLERLPGDIESMADLPLDRRQETNRRNGVFKAFLYGNFHPRRRASRRSADQHDFLFDWHEPRILYLALGVLLLSCTDALFTLNLLTIGASEANTFMATMLERGVDSFLAVKIGITSISLVVLVAAARRKFFRSFNVEHLMQAFCVAYVLVIIYEIYLFAFVFEVSLF
ncbi:MAG: DUF5658 family protein [Gammaproteobacteria bacterium]|nr:DUF5658 family protein [Gammaproteobacteria bacterium]